MFEDCEILYVHRSLGKLLHNYIITFTLCYIMFFIVHHYMKYLFMELKAAAFSATASANFGVFRPALKSRPTCLK